MNNPLALAALLVLVPAAAFAQSDDLPLMPQPDLPDAPPDATCATLEKLAAAAPGKFKSVQGKPGSTAGVFQSTVILPDMGCAVISAADAASSAQVVCRKELPADAEAEGIYHRKVEQIAGCLDLKIWEVVPDSVTSRLHNRVDTHAPEIEVGLASKGEFKLLGKQPHNLDVRLVAAPPVKEVDAAAFCKALGNFASKAQANFAEMRVDKNPLMGTLSCTNSVSDKKPARLDCHVYDGDDLWIARSTFRYFTERVAACLSTDEWTADMKNPAFTSKQTVLFENPSAQAPLILIVHDDNSLATPAQRKILHLAKEPVTVSMGLRAGMYADPDDGDDDDADDDDEPE